MPSSDNFVFYTPETLARYYGKRNYEERVGERLLTVSQEDGFEGLKDAKARGARYVIMGVPESVGPLANLGQSGAQNGWDAFLSTFAGMQDNVHLEGNKIVCLGHVNMRWLQAETGRLQKGADNYLERLRELCSKIDELVLSAVKPVFEQGMIPILIGGGHNNAYPLLKGAAQVLEPQKGVNCLNCDPHADYKPLEGRHSGNPFSYAKEEGFMNRYAVTGLHRNYNSRRMLEKMDQSPTIFYDFLEEIESWEKATEKAIHFLEEDSRPTGLELDLDSIAFMPVSAFTPSGLSVNQARFFVKKAVKNLEAAYLHLPEGAPMDMVRDNKIVGKALAFLVADFIAEKEKK